MGTRDTTALLDGAVRPFAVRRVAAQPNRRNEALLAVTSPLSKRWTVAALLTLTVVTGLIEAVSYLELGRVFVTNMTGNVVFLGFSIHPHSGLSALASLIALSGFAVGALLGGRLATHLAHRASNWLVNVFAIEAVVLIAVTVLIANHILPLAGRGEYETIAVLAITLGLQNATVRHLGVRDLTTTNVLTTTLTGLVADSTLSGGTGAGAWRRTASVLAMLAGAALGATLLLVSTTAVLALAATLVAAVAAAFLLGRPEADSDRSEAASHPGPGPDPHPRQGPAASAGPDPGGSPG